MEISRNDATDTERAINKNITGSDRENGNSQNEDDEKSTLSSETKDQESNNSENKCQSNEVDENNESQHTSLKEGVNVKDELIKTDKNLNITNDKIENPKEILNNKVGSAVKRKGRKFYNQKKSTSNCKQFDENEKNSPKDRVKAQSQNITKSKKSKKKQLYDGYLIINELEEESEFDEQEVEKKCCSMIFSSEIDKNDQKQKMIDNKRLDRSLDIGPIISHINKKYYIYKKEEITLQPNESKEDIPYLEEFGELVENIGENKFLWTQIDLEKTKENRKQEKEKGKIKQTAKSSFKDAKEGELGTIYHLNRQPKIKSKEESKYYSTKINLSNNSIAKCVYIQKEGKYRYKLLQKENATAIVLKSNSQSFCQMAKDRKLVEKNSFLDFSGKRCLSEVLFSNESKREFNMIILLQYKKK